MSERESTLFDELDAATEAEFDEMFSDMQENDEPEGFHITDDKLADWAVRKIQEEYVASCSVCAYFFQPPKAIIQNYFNLSIANLRIFFNSLKEGFLA